MQSAIVLQQAVNPVLTHLEASADLRLNQIGPLHCHHRFKNNHYNYSIISAQNTNDITSLLLEYNQRNCKYWNYTAFGQNQRFIFVLVSTHLTNLFTSNLYKDQSHFTVRLNIRYPEDAVYYRPGFWQVLKWAWVQYFAIYIIFAWFIRKVERYIFENRLVLCYISNAIKEKSS